MARQLQVFSERNMRQGRNTNRLLLLEKQHICSNRRLRTASLSKTSGSHKEADHFPVFHASLGNIGPESELEVRIPFALTTDGNYTKTSPAFGTATSYHPAIQVPNHGNSTNGPNSINVAEPTGTVGLLASPVPINLGSPAREPAGKFQISEGSVYPHEFIEEEVVISISPRKPDIERDILVEAAQGMEGVFELVPAPRPRPRSPLLPAQEYIFVVDRSYSMTGGRIFRVIEALTIMLKCLPNPPIRTFFVSCHLVHAQTHQDLTTLHLEYRFFWFDSRFSLADFANVQRRDDSQGHGTRQNHGS